MIIIVEGPDGAGKSTLVEKLLASNPTAKKAHFSAPRNEQEALNYYMVYYKAIKSVLPGQIMIFDRCWYSDLVYGPIMRGRTEMTLETAQMLNSAVLTNGGGMIIYCRASTNVLWQRCKKRGEKYVTSKDKLGVILLAYDDLMKENWYLPVVRYDTSNGF